MSSRFMTKSFTESEEIDDWLNTMASEFDFIEVVGYSHVNGRLCITIEIEFDEGNDDSMPQNMTD